ncbi:hypothetical protein SCHPADRAFT_946500 [Schizopora paradoxa]|uniref:Uncharacterized protein n=1 Tax=Schizopora paradoxa TaxID=27342 RepID=A0A0H2RM92_9AGAM|nr:hypothetical protein SCHPADRAFT_946500 [Schizopora paradoxa]
MNDGNCATHVFPVCPSAPPPSTAIQHHPPSTRSPPGLGALSVAPVLQMPPTSPIHARPAHSGALVRPALESRVRTPGQNVDLAPRLEPEPSQLPPHMLPAAEKKPKAKKVRFGLPTANTWTSWKANFPCNPIFIPPSPDGRTIYNPGHPPPKYHPARRHVGKMVGVRQRQGRQAKIHRRASSGGKDAGALLSAEQDLPTSCEQDIAEGPTTGQGSRK